MAFSCPVPASYQSASLHLTDQPPALLLDDRENQVFPSSPCCLMFCKSASCLPNSWVPPWAPCSAWCLPTPSLVSMLGPSLQPCARPCATCRVLPTQSRLHPCRLLLHLEQGVWTDLLPQQAWPPLRMVQKPSQIYSNHTFYGAKCISLHLSAIQFVIVVPIHTVHLGLSEAPCCLLCS